MYKQFGSLLVIFIAFTAILIPVTEFGRSFYIDRYYGSVAFSDLTFAITSAALAIAMAGAAWWADHSGQKWPIAVLPLGVVLAIGIGYGGTAYAFDYASEHYAVLTDDCYYPDVLVYQTTAGIFVSANGKTAFHPTDDIQSIEILTDNI